MNKNFYVVSQVKSNRVVYFTEDQNYQPPIEDDHFYVSTYTGELPSKMNLGNCWRWRFNGGIFDDTGAEPAPLSAKQSLLNHNRQALRRILFDKVNQVRRNSSPGLDAWAQVRAEQVVEARKLIAEPSSKDEFFYLKSLAVGRKCSLRQAAEFVLESAEKFAIVLRETQAFFEIYSHRISQAASEQELDHVREDLLRDFAPDLTHLFQKYRNNTQPLPSGAQLDAELLEHEKVRLSVQLKERVKLLKRTQLAALPLDPLYLLNVLRAAQDYLKAPELKDESDSRDLLIAIAENLGLELRAAAEKITADHQANQKIEMRLEVKRLQIETQIKASRTEQDLEQLGHVIGVLAL